MPSKFTVSEEVKELVHDIVLRQNLKSISDVKYQAGSGVGDGYASKTIAVDITNGKEILSLFVKCALNIKSTEQVPINKLYSNEIYFYDVVYPTYLKFLEDRKVENGFRNAPRCYGTSKENIVALENLRMKGYTLFDRRQIMNDSHIILVLKTFAKFHAISFAFKDQDIKNYEKLAENALDVFGDKSGETPQTIMMRAMINDFLKKLDPIKDQQILDKCDVNKLIDCLHRSTNKYSILTQGDCWCNNMMFLYEGEDKENPANVMLIDWQLIIPASPVLDLSYFFYSVASKEALSKLNNFLRIYHDELSKQIRALGSDPDILYPFHVLENEWKQHCRYGFTVAFIITKVMLSADDEVFNMEEMDFENKDQLENLYPKFEKEDQYINRIKLLAEHMIKNKYL